MPLESEINIERSRFGVHASGENAIKEDLLFLKMVSVVNNAVINNLSDKGDWRLSSVFINIRHVQIIHEIDELFAWWWAVFVTSTLVDFGLKNSLEGF